MSRSKVSALKYPDNKDFIFTIFDDTDVATLDYLKPIYGILNELGLKTTKTVWPLSFEGPSDYLGTDTLVNKEYASYLKELHQNGFEMSYHGPTMESSKKAEVEKSLEIFKEMFGFYPRSYSAHSTNRENLYWGADRFSIYLFKKIYTLISKEPNNHYQGHIENSEYFWGNLSLTHLDYIRNFTFNDLNLLNVNVPFPYQNKRQPYIKNSFFTSDADNVKEFNLLISEKNINRLEKERGVCIISTHFGKGFIQAGRVHEKTVSLLEFISKKNGWFVPVSEVLDFLKSQNSNNCIGIKDLFKLELKWFLDTLIRKNRERGYNSTELDYLKVQNIKKE